MCKQDNEEKPFYVELLENYSSSESKPFWLGYALRAIGSVERKRFEAQDGEFYCSFCREWTSASETQHVDLLFQPFCCNQCYKRHNAREWDRLSAESHENWGPGNLDATCLACGTWMPERELQPLTKMVNKHLGGVDWLVRKFSCWIK